MDLGRWRPTGYPYCGPVHRGLIGVAPSAISHDMMRAFAGFGLCTFKTNPFARFANREGSANAAPFDAVRRVGRGQVDAGLGGGVIKLRIARKGQDRSGALSVIVLIRRGGRCFFVYGFAKSDRENLRRDEIRALRGLANEMFGLDEPGLEAMLANGTVSEVSCDG